MTGPLPEVDDWEDCPVCNDPVSDRNPHPTCEAVLWPPRPTR